METFIDQALHPATRTCDAVAARLENLRTEMAQSARTRRGGARSERSSDCGRGLHRAARAQGERDGVARIPQALRFRKAAFLLSRIPPGHGHSTMY